MSTQENINGYNGWTNYATWRVNLEIFDGGEDGNEYMIEEYKDDAAGLADFLEEQVEDAVSMYGEIKEPSLALDYARAFISEVNYVEIAKHMIADWKSNKEYEEKKATQKA